MPLKFRDTGLALSPTEIRKDCTAFSGDWAVGYIYYEARERHGDCGRRRRPRRTNRPHGFGKYHGGLGKPMDMRSHGAARSLEDAKSYLEETWQRWLTWANLKETEPEG